IGFVCVLAAVKTAPADVVGYTGEFLSSGGSHIAFENTSDPGWSIKDITIDFSTANINTIKLNTNGIPALEMLPTGTYGSMSVHVTDMSVIQFSTLNVATDLTDLATFIGSGNMFTVSFAPGTFGSGQGWGFQVDWDRSPTDLTPPRRSEVSGAQVHVSFWEGPQPTVSYTFPSSKSNGVSMPFQASSFVTIPEPSAIVGLGVLVLGLVVRRRR
ncbi:MAG TPA: PEP-CTERM sorting domain-containing protein, partial [Pirellulaceae bacterium]|nr:PEP-CTERM sorting domain-containing protein [Pirellulaceae bacterium]